MVWQMRAKGGEFGSLQVHRFSCGSGQPVVNAANLTRNYKKYDFYESMIIP